MPAFVQQTQSQRLDFAGEGQMRFMGLRIYDARLWVAPGFDIETYGEHPLALELTYHRAFRGEAIARRSMVEIERQQPLPAERAVLWLKALMGLLPDVQPGDRLTGLFDPVRGLRLWRGNQAIGGIDDVELARRFFGIWLSANTSEPGLRRSLVARRSGVPK